MAFNIMIVDDSATTRAIVRRILEASGVEIGELLEAKNGAEALDLLKDKWIDLVFADINMPQMSGVEMVEKMSQNGLMDSVPVVIVSSDGSETRMEEMQLKGVKAYLRKPFTPEAIKEITEKLLGGAK